MWSRGRSSIKWNCILPLYDTCNTSLDQRYAIWYCSWKDRSDTLINDHISKEDLRWNYLFLASINQIATSVARQHTDLEEMRFLKYWFSIIFFKWRIPENNRIMEEFCHSMNTRKIQIQFACNQTTYLMAKLVLIVIPPRIVLCRWLLR